jgi:hypothetical protein
MRSNSIPKIKPRLGSWRRWMPFFRLWKTCRRLSLSVRDYLGSLLPGLADFPLNRVAELTPTAWAICN